MIADFRTFPRLRLVGRAVLFFAVLTAGRALPERNFEASRSLAAEVTTMVELLEDYHFNRQQVDRLPKPAIGQNLIKDFMAELDGQRLFLLATDQEAFTRRYANALYYNLQRLGDLKAAFDIYVQYEKRVETRVNWVFDQLNKDFDFATHEVYSVDRSKADWPATEAEADDLWRRRLKFELLQDLLNKKSIDEAKKNVHRRYERMLKNLADIETDEIAETFLTCLAQLYDPHSSYFSPKSYEDFGIHMRLSLVGIGALLGIEDDECVIKELIPGGPAELSRQVRTNDKIVAVTPEDGEPIDIIGMKLRKIVDLIRGPKGSKVRLTVVPADVTDGSVRNEITIVRDVVKLNSARARAAVYQVPGAGPAGETAPIGVITLPSFYGLSDSEDEGHDERTSATQDVADLIKQLNAAGIKGLVLDLRRNGGGLLSEAIEMTGLFIDHGPVVQVKNFSGDVKVDGDDDPRIAYSGPLAVLVSRFSASASEIVAGALQNYGRAVIIGDRSTHGKGSVQQVVEMKSVKGALARVPKTGAAKLTVQKFYLPNGASTQNKGVVPDIVLPSVDEFLPIVGESDLPHALIWDEIRPTRFSGHPLDPHVVTSLQASSQARQEQLEEFSYLRKDIDWLKARQDQKEVPLNLDERHRIKEADDVFKKEMDSEKDRLAKNDYLYKEFTVVPDPPKPAPPEKTAKENEPDELSTDEDPGIAKVDIHLRESLRVLVDAVNLSTNPHYWVNGSAPLTARVSKNG
ncbi:MAG: tail-specific protease [Verrucomicrobia bacterium RIFCSPLOWO2_12_FULL_64_8]|nr:MAG: tail-specific protease [Verrucomicrobia bacterium RIFCSPLOWO2_12_FULL_64_8]